MSEVRNGPSMPAIFISHGSPMVAIQQGPYQGALAEFGRKLRPQAIVAISAHWGSAKTIGITGSRRNTTVHDFGGFPPTLYDLRYDAPGSPELASRIAGLLRERGWGSSIATDRGLDHGVWIPLRLMYPSADIPVIELSVPLQFKPDELYRIGDALAPLRAQGVLILGSGGVVHNLRLVYFENADAPVDPWAAEFDAWLADAVVNKKLTDLFNFRNAAPHANQAVPTFEHFAPVFPVLGAGANATEISTIYQGFEHGNISMRSFSME